MRDREPAGEPDPVDSADGSVTDTSGTEPEEGHDPTGLDLARASARAAAAAGGEAARTPRRRRSSAASALGAEDPGAAQRRRRRRGMSGARPDDRDPQLLDGEVARLVAQRGWELDLRVHAVIGRWAHLVGPEIADHCTPESFVDGRLLVRTDSTAWATQLRLLAPNVLGRLNEEVGDGTVTQIEIAGPQAPSWKKGLRSVRDGRGPRDTYG